MTTIAKISFGLFLLASILKSIIFAYFSLEANHIGSKWLYYENHGNSSIFVGLCSILPEHSIQETYCFLKFAHYTDDGDVQSWIKNLPYPAMTKYNQLKGFN